MSRLFEEMTATELRQSAKQSKIDAQESFERSDTDGFLSQWASGITAQLYERQAEILDAGGKAEFWGLYEGARRVKAKLIYRPAFNAPWVQVPTWYVDRTDPISKIRQYIPEGENSRIQKKLGLSEKKELAPAIAKIMGSGTGLSGCANAYVGIERSGDEFGQDSVLA